jgi:hypothetical protein
VADVPPPDAPLTFDAAVNLSRSLLPNDAQPRARGPEGNQRYIRQIARLDAVLASNGYSSGLVS